MQSIRVLVIATFKTSPITSFKNKTKQNKNKNNDLKTIPPNNNICLHHRHQQECHAWFKGNLASHGPVKKIIFISDDYYKHNK